MHRLPLLVIVLAALGLVASSATLVFNLFGQASIPDRAQVSGAVGTLFTLAAGIVAIAAVGYYGSSDFKAEQAVKEDTARLLATLRSIIMKHAFLTQYKASRETGLDFATERKVLSDFLCSTTAFAYWAWVGHKDTETGPGAPEPWRVFFLYINDVLDANQRGRTIALAADKEEVLARLRGSEAPETGHKTAAPADLEQIRLGLRDKDDHERARMISRAACLELLLTGLTDKDVRTIGGYLVDLPKAIGTFRNVRGQIIQHYVEQANCLEAETAPSSRSDVGKHSGAAEHGGDAAGPSEGSVTYRKFQHLMRKKGVDDPNVRLFEAVLQPGPETPESVAQVRKALEDGADPRITDTEVLAQYAAELADFR
jgi:hypothetical protein